MKKVKLVKGQYHSYLSRLEEDTQFSCPVSCSSCGSDCAWFDISEGCNTIEIKDGSNFTVNTDIKVITCKGIPIAELIEE